MSDHDDIGDDQVNAPPAGPAVSDEQAADFRRLQLAAAEPNAELQQLEQAEQEQEQAVQQSLVEKNAQALALVCDLAIPTFSMFGFPTLAGVLQAPHDQMQGATNGQALAHAWAPVLTKYGIDLGDMGGKYAAEISAVVVTLPVAKAIMAAMRQDTGQRPKPAHQAVASSAQEAPKAPDVVKLG